jgi:hypothetical protein
LAQSTVPEKLLRVVDEIDARGSANLTRLTVLKKWFERAGRLSAFALWVAARASSRKGKTSGAAAELFREARTLLHGLDKVHPKPNRAKAQDLHGRLRAFQSEHQRQRCGRVRIVHNWNLLLLEKGLAVHLWHANSLAHGYELAADYCRHFDSRHGDSLNGPSRTKIMEIVRFMFVVEALEEPR